MLSSPLAAPRLVGRDREIAFTVHPLCEEAADARPFVAAYAPRKRLQRTPGHCAASMAISERSFLVGREKEYDEQRRVSIHDALACPRNL
jgi:hypothetical protein